MTWADVECYRLALKTCQLVGALASSEEIMIETLTREFGRCEDVTWHPYCLIRSGGLDERDSTNQGAVNMTPSDDKPILRMIDDTELAPRPRVGRGHFAGDARMRPVNISLPPDIVARLSTVKQKSHLIEKLLRFYFSLIKE